MREFIRHLLKGDWTLMRYRYFTRWGTDPQPITVQKTSPRSLNHILSVRLSSEDMTDLSKRADAKGITTSALVRLLVHQHLNTPEYGTSNDTDYRFELSNRG